MFLTKKKEFTQLATFQFLYESENSLCGPQNYGIILWTQNKSAHAIFKEFYKELISGVPDLIRDQS